MFEIITINDMIEISSRYLSDIDAAILKKVRDKFEYRPLQNYGYCIKVLGIKASQGHVQDGDILYKLTLEILSVHFFESELLYGKIEKCTSEGVIVKFFENKNNDKCIQTFVPKNKLLENSLFDDKLQVWKVNYDNIDFVYCKGIQVRFLIDCAENKDAKSEEYIVISRMNKTGLGGIDWWI